MQVSSHLAVFAKRLPLLVLLVDPAQQHGELAVGAVRLVFGWHMCFGSIPT